MDWFQKNFFVQELKDLKQKAQDNKLLSIFALLSALLAGRVAYWKIYKKYKKLPPGPIGLPFIGIQIGKMIPYLRHKYYRSEMIIAQYGTLAYYLIGRQQYITIADTKVAKYVLSNKNALFRPPVNGKHPSVFANETGDLSFIDLNGPQWIARRRMAQSILIRMCTSKYLNEVIHHSVINTVIPILEELHVGNDAKPWYPRQIMSYVAFNTIFHANFGKSIAIDDELGVKLRNIIEVGGRTSSLKFRFFPFLTYFPSQMKPFINIRRERAALIMQLIDRRKREYFDENKEKPITYIDHMLHESYTNGSISINQIMIDIGIIFFAGTDTTSSTMEFAFFLLTKYPNIQQQVRNELKQHFSLQSSGYDGDVISDLNELHFLRAFVYETLRISSVAFLGVLRYANEDIHIPADLTPNEKECIIPKGANIVYMVHEMHHRSPLKSKTFRKSDEKLWKAYDDEPCLENWLDDEQRFVMNRNQFFAFGYGRRDCIGKNIATKELFIVVALLLLRYQFNFADCNPNATLMYSAKRTLRVMSPSVGLTLTPL